MRRILVCVLSLVVSGVVAAQEAKTVPAYLAAETHRPLVEFALLVSNALLPAGFEIHEGDDTRSSRAINGPLPQVPVPQDGKRISIDELVNTFNLTNQKYKATLSGGVFLVRPIAGRLAFLDQPSTLGRGVKVTGVHQTIRMILSPLDARLLGPTVGVLRGKEAAKGFSTEFTLDGSSGRRVIDTLNQIVTQMHGAWQITTRRKDDQWEVARFGFVYSDFATSRGTMPAKD